MVIYISSTDFWTSSLNTLPALTMQIGSAEPPLASFLLVLCFNEESLGYMLQASLDSTRGELPF